MYVQNQIYFDKNSLLQYLTFLKLNSSFLSAYIMPNNVKIVTFQKPSFSCCLVGTDVPGQHIFNPNFNNE